MERDLLDQLRSEMQHFRQLQKARDRVDVLNKDHAAMEGEMTVLQDRLAKEYAEYEHLQGASLKGTFYSILGSKEKQLEKERQEYLQLTLKYDELKERMKLVEFELGVLSNKLTEYNESYKRIESLKEERKKQLSTSNSPDALRLRELLAKQDDIVVFQQDVQEALAIGDQLQQMILQLIHLLKSARNWGRWDMGSRSAQYKYKKHTNIDIARQQAFNIQQLLPRFNKEVRDVFSNYAGLQSDLEVDRIAAFTNVFFDNLLSDWIVQQRIINTYNQAAALLDHVKRIMSSLQIEQNKSDKDIKNLKEELEALIEGR